VKHLLDTDHWSLLHWKLPAVVKNLAAHQADDVKLGVISIEEQLLGWLAEIRKTKDRGKQEAAYRRMAFSIQELSGWEILPYTVPAMLRFDGLFRLRLNVGPYDLKIAAIALEVGATVVTRNARDFSRVPGLSIVDWSK
jgi:tRNA(fMet)-specific endonuclease VapC